MDNYFFISRLCLAALLTFGCLAQDDEPLSVRFQTPEKTLYYQVGAEDVQLTCILNRGPFFVAQNKLEIIHRNPLTQEERGMSLGAILEDAADPTYYDTKIDRVASKDNSFHVIFTIKSVRDSDDGTYICQAKDSVSNEETTSEIEFVVVRPLTEVKLQFDGHEAITTKPEDPIEVDAGLYDVTCMALGANPSTEDVSLYLDGVALESGPVAVNLSEGTDVRSYVSTVTAQVDITVHNSGKDLQCVAKSKMGDVTKTTELGISVNTYDPHVICNDSKAFEGQMYPILTCIVNHTDIVIEGFAFQIGKTGQIIEDGGSNVDNVKVKSERIDQDVTQVSLNLHQAKDWHFEDDFYVIIRSKGGHTTRERVVLEKMTRIGGGKVDDGGDAASTLCGSMALVLSVAMLMTARLF